MPFTSSQAARIKEELQVFPQQEAPNSSLDAEIARGVEVFQQLHSYMRLKQQIQSLFPGETCLLVPVKGRSPTFSWLADRLIALGIWLKTL
jgi:hypothetical protein